VTRRMATESRAWRRYASCSSTVPPHFAESRLESERACPSPPAQQLKPSMTESWTASLSEFIFALRLTTSIPEKWVPGVGGHWKMRQARILVFGQHFTSRYMKGETTSLPGHPLIEKFQTYSHYELWKLAVGPPSIDSVHRLLE
jgi:hypothetical protein